MCNFIIRDTVKSYATADTHIMADEGVHVVKKGTVVKVLHTTADGVMCKIGDKEYLFSYDQFTHVFSDKDPNKQDPKKS